MSFRSADGRPACKLLYAHVYFIYLYTYKPVSLGHVRPAPREEKENADDALYHYISHRCILIRVTNDASGYRRWQKFVSSGLENNDVVSVLEGNVVEE